MERKSYAFDPKIEGISSAVSKFTMHPFDGRKALKIMREDVDAKFFALKERLEEKKEKFVGKLETFVKVSKNGKRWSFLPIKEYIDRYKIFDIDKNNVLTIRVKFELPGYVEKPLEAAAERKKPTDVGTILRDYKIPKLCLK